MKSMTTKHQIVAVLLLLCFTSAFCAGSSAATPFPAEGTYDFYIYSELAGSNSFTSSVKNNILSIVSSTSLAFGEYSLEIDSKTQVDATTLNLIEFSYKGVEGDVMQMSGIARTIGDTLEGTMVQNETTFPSKVLTDIQKTVIFESYVAEHEILLAQKFLASGEDFKEIIFFYPSDFTLTGSMMSIESDIELETKIGAVLCTKISVSLQGGTPFFSYIDKEANIPIYMDFPGVNTEIFHRSYYGDEAQPKYFRPTK